MLVNVSRFTAVQDQVATLIYEKLATIHQDVRNYSQLSPRDALRNGSIAKAHEVWQREYSTAGYQWEHIQRALLDSALPVSVKAVNQRTGAASLDYARYKEAGLRVIAVGGNSLSRGLTLAGLSTSYFFRNSQMYDTLLQMGRWFGYRDGYADLCRLWITDEAAQWYSHITSATEELREEVKRMQKEQATPMDFGLKVRAHPDALLVTAQNKMRQAKIIERIISLSGRMLETARLRSNPNSLSSNLGAVARFVNQLLQTGFEYEQSVWKNTIWRKIPKKFIVSLLRDFDVHPLNVAFQSGDLVRFLENTAEPILQTWDVVMPHGSGKEVKVGPISVQTSRRSIVERNGMLLVSGTRARVGSRGVEKEGLDISIVRSIEEEYARSNPGKSIPDKAYRVQRPRPLLLLHVLSTSSSTSISSNDEMAALGLSFPRFDDSDVAKRAIYRVNLVEWRSVLEEEIDDDLQEEGDDR